jgi:exonuclease III
MEMEYMGGESIYTNNIIVNATGTAGIRIYRGTLPGDADDIIIINNNIFKYNDYNSMDEKDMIKFEASIKSWYLLLKNNTPIYLNIDWEFNLLKNLLSFMCFNYSKAFILDDIITDLFENVGWVDTYRKLYPDTTDTSYTWWSNRGEAYAKNVGWRLDYQIAHPSLKDQIVEASIYKNEKFSDHAPLIIDYKL